jgi:endonuclease G
VKKLLSVYRILLLALLLSAPVYAQHISDVAGHPNIKKLKYQYYTSYFSTQKHIPILVTYKLTRSMVACSAENRIKRRNNFRSDPEFKEETVLQKDYTHSGYDRGHNMSAADNACDSTGMRECFYFSNITPQPHSFNAGVWEQLEKQERTEAIYYETIIVSIGSIGTENTIGVDEVVVPKWMWKVIFIPDMGEYECYIFPDADGDDDVLDKYQTTLKYIEKEAGVRFHQGAARLN